MYEDNNTTKRGFFKKGKLNGLGMFEDRKMNVTLSGFLHSGLLEGQGVIEDKKNKITKRGNFKGGKLFGLGEVKYDNWQMRGQFGPAGDVKHDTSKCNYVTLEGELLQGTAIIKQGSW